MSNRYAYCNGKWHKANQTQFLWLKSDCDLGAMGACICVVLLEEYSKRVVGSTLVVAADMQGFKVGDALCCDCFGKVEPS